MNPVLTTVLAGSLVLAWLAGCATPPAGGPAQPGDPKPTAPDLPCMLPTNCSNSMVAGGLAPLRYSGASTQASAALLATLAEFPEAMVVRNEPLRIEAIFTTTIGFRDEVVFQIVADDGLIHFRSRSLFGLFDFGKNRLRMELFAARFARHRAS